MGIEEFQTPWSRGFGKASGSVERVVVVGGVECSTHDGGVVVMSSIWSDQSGERAGQCLGKCL